MRKRLCILLSLLAFTATGCASQTSLSYLDPTPQEAANTQIFGADINKVWDAAIKSIGEQFFVLDNIEKDSKIITLSFSVDNPEEYIDCGLLTYDNSGGMSGNGQTSFAGAAKYATFLRSDGTPHPKLFERRTKLEGKVNIIFSTEGKNKTRAIINSHDIMSIAVSGHRFVPQGYSGSCYPSAILPQRHSTPDKQEKPTKA